jgi:hypothetical protein
MKRYLMCSLMIAVCAATLLGNSVCQELDAKPVTEVRTGHQVVSRVPADMLAQLSCSLQQLASKVSPAVVQIEVTRFGPAQEGNRENTVLMVRQRAICPCRAHIPALPGFRHGCILA